MTKEQVISRIDDWVHRLEGLYDLVETWFKALPEAPNKEPLEGSVLQRDEPLMRQFDVPPRMIPTRAFLYGKNRVSFVPSALWVIGANGRVNVTVGGQQYILVDMGGQQGQQSDWQIVTSRLGNVQRPFDQQVFNNLVLNQAIEAA